MAGVMGTSSASAVEQLEDTVEDYAEQARRQSSQMIWLTVAIVGLTVAMLLAVGVQFVATIVQTVLLFSANP